MNKRQSRGLLKLGDAYCPGSVDFPKFSNTKAINRIDEMLPHLPQQDQKDLLMLMGVLSFIPNFLILIFIYKLEWFSNFPGPIGAFVRKTRLGLKGLIYGLYYSDPKIQNIIGYDAHVDLA